MTLCSSKRRPPPASRPRGRNLLQKLFCSASHEHRLLKGVFRVFGGLLFAGLVFLIILYQRDVEFKWPEKEKDEAVISEGQSMLNIQCGNETQTKKKINLQTLDHGYWITAGVLILLFVVSFVASQEIQCLTTLMIPSLFTTRGRVMLYSIVLTILLMGPVERMKSNVQVVSESMSCSKNEFANRTRRLRTQIQEEIQNQKEKISIITERLMRSTIGFFKSLPLGKVELKYFCLKKPEDEACSEKSKFAINQTDISKYDNNLEFNFSMTQPNITFSKSLQEIRCDIYTQVEMRLRSVTEPLRRVGQFLTLTIALLIVEAWWYKRNYKNKEHYDNHYITKDFKELDNEKRLKGERSLGDLRLRERKRLTDATTLRMSWLELKVVALWGLVWILFVVMGFVLCITDWGLYQVLELIRTESNNTMEVTGGINLTANCLSDGKNENGGKAGHCSPNLIKLVEDNAPFTMGNFLSLDFTEEILTEECLPRANSPFIGLENLDEPQPSNAFLQLIALYLTILLITLLQAYGLRLRHTIAAWFYPDRERVRVNYLHTSMLMRRKSLARFFFSRRQADGRFDIFDWLESRHPSLIGCLRLCRLVKAKCQRCGKRSRLKQLAGSSYCYDCHDEIFPTLTQNIGNEATEDGGTGSESEAPSEPEVQLRPKRSVRFAVRDSSPSRSRSSRSSSPASDTSSSSSECCGAARTACSDFCYFIAGLVFGCLIVLFLFYNQNVEIHAPSLSAPSPVAGDDVSIRDIQNHLLKYGETWGVQQTRNFQEAMEKLRAEECMESRSKPFDSEKTNLETIPLHVWALAASFVLLLSTGVAFSRGIRCVAALLVPGIFSTRGRAVLFSFLIQRLLQGPVQQMKNNTHKIADSMACMSKQVVTKTLELKDDLVENLRNETQNYDETSTLFDAFFKLLKSRTGNSKRMCLDITLPLSTNENVTLSCNDISSATRLEFEKKISEPTLNINKSFAEIQCDINGRIHATMGLVEKNLTIIGNLIGFLVLLLIIEAIWYWWCYVHKDDHDNRYITKKIVEMDEKRKSEKVLRVLPLRKKERHHIIEVDSPLLSRDESKTLFVWGIFWFLFLLFGVILFVTDYGLAWVLGLFEESSSDVTITVTATFSMTPIYNNFSPTIENWLNETFNLGKPYHVNQTLPVGSCLKKPSPAFVYSGKPFTIVIILYIATLGLTIFQAYGLRLQRTISAYFYQEREWERSEFFIKKTLLERMSRIKTMVSAKIDECGVVVGRDELDEFQSFNLRWPSLANFLVNLNLLKRRCFFCGEEWRNTRFFREFESATDEDDRVIPKTICRDCRLEFTKADRGSIGIFLRDSRMPPS